MDFRTYVTALRRRWWVAALITVLAVVASGLAYTATPPTYATGVTFYVRTPVQNGMNPQSVTQFAQDRVNSYVVLMSSERVAQDVITSTGVKMSPRDVAREITAEADLNTVVMRATVRDGSAQRSLLLAQGLASTFGSTVSRLDNTQVGKTPTVIIDVVSGPTALGRVAPSLKVYGGLGLLVGLAVGVLLVLVLEILDNTVRTVGAAAALVGAPVIGNIRYDPAARKAPLIVGDRSGSVRSEAFRQLRTNLQFINVAHSTQVLVVTSAAPSEGKTSVCVNLALALAEAGRRVLILDGDLRRPQVANLLGLEPELGLTTVLLGQIDLDRALQPWSSGITALTSGPLPPNPSELLGGRRMAELLSALRPRFDDILIDTPPLLPVTDAAVAATLGDGVVLTIRYAKTTREQVLGAVHALRSVDVPILGSVINMRRLRRHERRGYGYAPGFSWQQEPVEPPVAEQHEVRHLAELSPEKHRVEQR